MYARCSTADQTAAVSRALDVFRQECPLIFDRWGDVDRASASFHRIVVPIARTEAFGWSNEVRLEMVVGGDRLTYYLGAGHTPGILAKKASAQQLCPMPVKAGEDSLKPAAELAFLDGV